MDWHWRTPLVIAYVQRHVRAVSGLYNCYWWLVAVLTRKLDLWTFVWITNVTVSYQRTSERVFFCKLHMDITRPAYTNIALPRSDVAFSLVTSSCMGLTTVESNSLCDRWPYGSTSWALAVYYIGMLVKSRLTLGMHVQGGVVITVVVLCVCVTMLAAIVYLFFI